MRRVSVHAGIKHVNKKIKKLVEHHGASDCTSTHTSNSTSSTSRTSSRTSSCSFLQLFLSLEVSTIPTMRVPARALLRLRVVNVGRLEPGVVSKRSEIRGLN